MSQFLQSMEQSSRARLGGARARRTLETVIAEALSAPAPRGPGSFGETFDLIAEIKPRSPAEGELGTSDLVARASAYQDGGSGMLSVLTEPEAFGGSLELLQSVAAEARVPVLRKDFLVDPYQVFEARAAGADGVLVIARLLSDATMAAILDAVAQTAMFALLEAFDASDLKRVSTFTEGRGDLLVGVNCRDLETLRTEPSIHAELAAGRPDRPPLVAESGILATADIRRVARLGYRGALVGTALMRADDPASMVAAMLTAGRETMRVAAP